MGYQDQKGRLAKAPTTSQVRRGDQNWLRAKERQAPSQPPSPLSQRQLDAWLVAQYVSPALFPGPRAEPRRPWRLLGAALLVLLGLVETVVALRDPAALVGDNPDHQTLLGVAAILLYGVLLFVATNWANASAGSPPQSPMLRALRHGQRDMRG